MVKSIDIFKVFLVILISIVKYSSSLPVGDEMIIDDSVRVSQVQNCGKRIKLKDYFTVRTGNDRLWLDCHPTVIR